MIRRSFCSSINSEMEGYISVVFFGGVAACMPDARQPGEFPVTIGKPPDDIGKSACYSNHKMWLE